MKAIKIVSLTAAGIVLLVAFAGFIKFNFLDVPYLGDSVVYTSEAGENIETHFKVDDSVVVYFMAGDRVRSHFTAKPVADGSRGEDESRKYESKDGRSVLSIEGGKAAVFRDAERVYIGVRGLREAETNG